MGNQVVIRDLPYKLDLSSYEYPMSAAFGTIFRSPGNSNCRSMALTACANASACPLEVLAAHASRA
jgi:hypothetical protein